MSEAKDCAQWVWPVARAAEAMEVLASQAGLLLGAPRAGEAQEVLVLPSELDVTDAVELDRWIDWSARRLGFEVESVAMPMGELLPLLRRAAPAMLNLPQRDGVASGCLLVLKSQGSHVTLMGPDLRPSKVAVQVLIDWLCTPLQTPYLPAIDRLLDVAEVPAERRTQARLAMLQEHLASEQVGSCWLLRASPDSGLWAQVTQARLPRQLVWMMTAFLALYVAEMAGWGLMGQMTLNGHLDSGWFIAWVMLMLSLVPLRLIAGWLDASFALDFGRLLKTRLLSGILRSDPDAVRRQGAGQLLSQVMESQALEALALNGGMGVLVAVLELAIAAGVLVQGAGGSWHLALLVVWILVAVALSWRYGAHQREWTLKRLAMTHALVERMVGHRTRLAQERPGRRDAQDDLDMRDYLTASRAMDRSIVPAAAIMPRGWMLVGLLGLLPSFAAGQATPGSLAVALGGMLLANRALMGVSAGLASLSRAQVAWSQVAALFVASPPSSGSAPFLSTATPPAKPEATHPSPVHAVNAVPVIDACDVTFQYAGQSDKVVEGLNLCIHAGDRVLLEGPSGSGKSTVASLLVGLRTPHSGLLLLNGWDRHTLGDSWHQWATEAPQFHENHILSGTLAFNLLMGRRWPANADDLADAAEICEELGLGDLLSRMPSGLMQMVGETGWQLSHGERSRIFLARALLQKAELTVLDESFAALDPETLARCLACALRQTNALVVIAHP